MRSWRHSLVTFALAAPALGFLAVFFFYPLLRILGVSFVPGDLSQGALPWQVAREPAYLRVLAFTTGQAALSTALTLLVGLPIAFALGRFRFPLQRLWRALAVVPFVMPTVVTAAAFSALLGPRGAVNQLLQAALGANSPLLQLQGTLTLVLLAHVFYNVAVVVRIVGGFLAAFNPRIEEAAASLGATPAQTLLRVTLPLALPAIGAASALTFLFTFTSFGVMLLLGGARFATLEVEIYRQTAQLLRLDVATSLALLQLIVTVLVSGFAGQLERRAGVPLESQTTRLGGRAPESREARLLVVISVLVIVLLLGAPMVALVARSLGEWENPLRFYLALGQNTRNALFFVPPLIAVRNSLMFATIAALLCLALSLPLAYAMARDARFSRLMESVLLMPIGASAVTLGLGYVIAFSAPPLNLRISPLLVPIAHALIALPFVVRSVLPAVRALDVRLREAAQSLGAGPVAVLRHVDLPLLSAPFGSAAVFAFTISLGEFGASLLIARPEFPTLTTAIFRFLGQPGEMNYGQALAMSTILMLITLVAALLIEWLNERWR